MTTTLNQKICGFIQILRPELPFAAGACVVLGAVVAIGGFPTTQAAVVGFLCGFFISGSAIVLNDYFDLEVDRINTPERPLPAGLVSPMEAIWLSVLTGLIGLALSYAIGFAAFLLCIVFWIIGVLYNWKFKEEGFAGNLMVSSSVGITLILGGMSVHQPWNPIVWCFAMMAFFVDLGEEIAGDAMDIDGDKQRGSKSLAIRKGKQFALRLAAALFGLVVLTSLLPALLGWMGLSYLLLILLTDVLIVVFTIRLLKSKTPREGRSAMRGIYLGALVGVLSAIAGQILV